MRNIYIVMMIGCSDYNMSDDPPTPNAPYDVDNSDECSGEIIATCPAPVIENTIENTCPEPIISVETAAPVINVSPANPAVQVNVQSADVTCPSASSSNSEVIMIDIHRRNDDTNTGSYAGYCAEGVEGIAQGSWTQATDGCLSTDFSVNVFHNGIVSNSGLCARYAGVSADHRSYSYDLNDCCPDGYEPIGFGPKSVSLSGGAGTHDGSTLLCRPN